ncbi:DUF2393 domain-containing protein [Helicobacter jaachi]|uniref:DUF2393 domain-containing protein n=1 Tax=Helicobacter jaachi TaxID=1677920 RepID=A0A4U8T8N7_9HELI|nr:DUF2393 domain-containing protein [Helicobacter jaachi]TLD96051.1 DUF2393 domain-containing protein [Helicobacter jaachi]
MFENIKALLLQMVSYLSVYEIGALLAGFFVFIMIFTLGLLLRGWRFLARFCFLLSMAVIFAMPFVLHFVMRDILYKIDVNITSAHAMQYTKGFFVSGSITHKGKVAINECHIAVNEVRDEKGSVALGVLNSILPKHSSYITIDIDIEVGESKDFAVIVPKVEGKEPFLYRIYVDCYLSNKFAQKMQSKHVKGISSHNPQAPTQPTMPTHTQNTATLIDKKDDIESTPNNTQDSIKDSTTAGAQAQAE